MEKLNVEYNNLGHLLDQSILKYGHKPLFFFPDHNLEINYAEFGVKVNKIANLLIKLGVVKGDRVGVMLPNVVEFPMIWLAAAKCGAVMVPINNSYQSADLKYILNDSGVKALFIDYDYLTVLESISTNCPGLKTIVGLGNGNAEYVINFTEKIDKAIENFTGPEVQLDDLVNIQYTSGTTGFPKGCMLTHKYFLQLGQIVTEYLKIQEYDRDLCAQPFYYIDAQWNTISCLMNGIALVILKRFSSSRHWNVCLEYGVTFFYCVGTMPVYLASMPEDPETEKQHQLRVVLCSGINSQMHKYYENRWNVPWREAFGMTETGADLLVPLSDTTSVGSGAMGLPISSKEAKIVNKNEQEVSQGQIGHLILRGEPMMLGYWNKPEATAEIMKDGWLHTGDLAYVDEKGYFHWVGRVKDMVRRGGENISTAEVESILMEQPKIKLAAVIPVPDPLRGEEVKAYIVLKENETEDTMPPQEIIGFAKSKLSAYKVPRYIEYRDDLPRTPSERVEKHKLLKEKNDLRLNSYDDIDNVWR